MKIHYKQKHQYFDVTDILAMPVTSRCEVNEKYLYKLNQNFLLRIPKNKNTKQILYKLNLLATNYGYKKGLTFLCSNSKTGDSIDFTNQCHFQCSYCYVNTPHIQKRIEKHFWEIDNDFLSAEKENLFIEYLRKRKQITKTHFLRFFSLADCRIEMVGMLIKLLNICQKNDIKTVVITKNEKIIPDIISVATSTIYSIDNGNFHSPSSIKKYKKLAKKFPTLKGFGMVSELSDIKLFYTQIPKKYHDRIQFVGYHGKLLDGLPLLKPQLLQILTKRACCLKGSCINCSFQCQI